MPFLYETQGRFVAACIFQDRHIPQDAGFKFSPERREYWTTDPAVAYRLIKWAHESTAAYLNERFKKLLPKTHEVSAHNLKASPSFRKQAKKYQLKGALHILSRSSSMLWYDAGTGKTATATLALEYLAITLNKLSVVICPSFMARTWREEIDRVSKNFLDVHIVEDRADRPRLNSDVIIVPDSLLSDELLTHLLGGNLGALIIDEAHRFKNDRAARTKLMCERKPDEVNKYAEAFRHVCVMSGTPSPNYKPIELYPLLNAFAPWAIGFMSKPEYGVRYCGAVDNGFGLEYGGATRIDELISNLKDSGYLLYQGLSAADLPDQAPDAYIYLDKAKQTSAVVKAEEELRGKLSLAEILKLALKDSPKLAHKYNFKLKIKGEALDPAEFMSELRKLAGLNTAAAALPILEEVIKNDSEPVVIFAWHKEVIARLKVGLEKYDPLVIDGSVHKDLRQGIVDTFQTSKTPRPLIVNIAAGGVGFTMTRAYKVYFVEFSYVDGENEQAVRRLRRLGQTRKVLPYYFIFKDSLAHTMLGILDRKQNNKAAFKTALTKE